MTRKILVSFRLDAGLRRQIRGWARQQTANRPTQEPLTEAAAIRELLRSGLRAESASSRR